MDQCRAQREPRCDQLLFDRFDLSTGRFTFSPGRFSSHRCGILALRPSPVAGRGKFIDRRIEIRQGCTENRAELGGKDRSAVNRQWLIEYFS